MKMVLRLSWGSSSPSSGEWVFHIHGPYYGIHSLYHIEQRILQPVAGGGWGRPWVWQKVYNSNLLPFLGSLLLWVGFFFFYNRDMEIMLPKTSHTNSMKEKPGNSWGGKSFSPRIPTSGKLLEEQLDAEGGQSHGGLAASRESHGRGHEEKTFAMKNL